MPRSLSSRRSSIAWSSIFLQGEEQQLDVRGALRDKLQ